MALEKEAGGNTQRWNKILYMSYALVGVNNLELNKPWFPHSSEWVKRQHCRVSLPWKTNVTKITNRS